jgi:hypothetical protein
MTKPDVLDRTETTAVERAFPAADPRFAALPWSQRAVAALIRAAAWENSRQGTVPGRRSWSWRHAGLAIAGLATAFFAALGAVTVVQLLVP